MHVRVVCFLRQAWFYGYSWPPLQILAYSPVLLSSSFLYLLIKKTGLQPVNKTWERETTTGQLSKNLDYKSEPRDKARQSRRGISLLRLRRRVLMADWRIQLILVPLRAELRHSRPSLAKACLSDFSAWNPFFSLLPLHPWQAIKGSLNPRWRLAAKSAPALDSLALTVVISNTSTDNWVF